MSDMEKQNTMNVFLGVYKPEMEEKPISDKDFSDVYLHKPELYQELGPNLEGYAFFPRANNFYQ